METNDKTTAMPTLTLDPFGAQAAAEQRSHIHVSYVKSASSAVRLSCGAHFRGI